MDLFTLFPQPIAKLKLEKTGKYKKLLIPNLKKQFNTHPELVWDWGINSYSWSKPIEAMPEELGNDISSAVMQWMKSFNFPDSQWYLTAWWNVYTWDMYQDTHNHIGRADGTNVLSGIYYLQLPEFARGAVFFNDKESYYSILHRLGTTIDHPFFTNSTSGVESFKISEGDLILFTPDQKHLAPRSTQKHDELRISLSFNVTLPFIPSGDA